MYTQRITCVPCDRGSCTYVGSIPVWAKQIRAAFMPQSCGIAAVGVQDSLAQRRPLMQNRSAKEAECIGQESSDAYNLLQCVNIPIACRDYQLHPDMRVPRFGPHLFRCWMYQGSLLRQSVPGCSKTVGMKQHDNASWAGPKQKTVRGEDSCGSKHDLDSVVPQCRRIRRAYCGTTLDLDRPETCTAVNAPPQEDLLHMQYVDGITPGITFYRYLGTPLPGRASGHDRSAIAKADKISRSTPSAALRKEG